MPAPRTVTPPDEELEELGKEMVEWVKKNNPIHLSQWYSQEKMIIYKDWKAMIQKESFLPYYERALLYVGMQYLDKNSNIREGVSQRWQRVYFKELRDTEDEQVEHKARIQAQANIEEQKENLSNFTHWAKNQENKEPEGSR